MNHYIKCYGQIFLIKKIFKCKKCINYIFQNECDKKRIDMIMIKDIYKNDYCEYCIENKNTYRQKYEIPTKLEIFEYLIK